MLKNNLKHYEMQQNKDANDVPESIKSSMEVSHYHLNL